MGMVPKTEIRPTSVSAAQASRRQPLTTFGQPAALPRGSRKSNTQRETEI